MKKFLEKGKKNKGNEKKNLKGPLKYEMPKEKEILRLENEKLKEKLKIMI